MSTLKVTNLQHGSATAPAISVAVGGGATVLGITTFHNNVDLLDDDRLRLGAGQDLQIYHNSSNDNTYIQESGGGQLIIQTNAFRLLNAAGSENMIDADEDGAAKLYHNGSTRFETESGGAKVGGNDGVALTIDCPNAYSNSASIMMSQGRGEIKTTLDASGGNPGGTMVLRTRNTAGSLVDSLTIENGQQVLINSVAGTHPLRVSNGGVERLRVASTGNVGVGTVTPTGNFEVSGNDGLTVSNATRSGTNGVQWRLIPHNGGGSATNLRLFEGTGGTEVINITKDGKVLVGTTSPSLYADRLLTVGDTSESSSTIEIRSATNGWGGLAFSDSTAADTNSYRGTIEYDHTNDRMQIRVAGDVIGRVVSSGNIQTLCTNSTNLDTSNTASAGNTHEFLYMRHSSTSITTGTNSFRVTTNGNVTNTNNSYGPLSDVKLKENIVDAGSQWDDFKAVRFRKFNFKEETGHETHTQLGVIAQELELTSPGLVYELSEKDMDGNPTGETTKAVMSSVLTSKGLVALQEAMARIETLEAEVAALKGS